MRYPKNFYEREIEEEILEKCIITVYNELDIKQTVNVSNFYYLEKEPGRESSSIMFEVENNIINYVTLLTEKADIGIVPVFKNKQIVNTIGRLSSSIVVRTTDIDEKVYITYNDLYFRIISANADLLHDRVKFSLRVKKL